MSPRARIGLFPYLNVQPLIHGLREDERAEVVIDVPSRTADAFRRGELDLAMVPSFEAATLDAPVLEGIAIAAEGTVETVLLHHRVPLAEVRTLAADASSRTSVALSKILVAQASGHVPITRPFEASSGESATDDAILVIGDPAFAFTRPGYAPLDLATAWKQAHNLPFVFAVMVVNPRTLRPGLASWIRDAITRGLDAASTIAASYNSGVDAARAEHYMRDVIRYDLGPREKEGLALFHRLAQEHGLLPRTKELEFHGI
jgi:chorismate dehydratase